jgi:predicted RNA-binding Zn-ribbon protein involved in translation (DUF1610 family)
MTVKDMINKLQRFQEEVQNFGTQHIPVDVDEKGMIDKQCPKENCGQLFKVNVADWKNIFINEAVYCPVCRAVDLAKEFMPKEQFSQIRHGVIDAIMNNWKHNKPMTLDGTKLITTSFHETELSCNACNARYSVHGNAYFCPNCGNNALDQFTPARINNTISTLENIDAIQAEFEVIFGKSEGIAITKKFIENELVNCIGLLQAFSEYKYNKISETPAPFNAFQNLDRADDLWQNLTGEGYDCWLAIQERQLLLVCTNQRHLIEHKGGIVDNKYLQNTGDTTYRTEMRIVVTAERVIELAKVVQKLVTSIGFLR